MFFSRLCLSKKLLLQCNFFLRKWGAKVIANKNVMENVHKEASIGPPRGGL